MKIINCNFKKIFSGVLCATTLAAISFVSSFATLVPAAEDSLNDDWSLEEQYVIADPSAICLDPIEYTRAIRAKNDTVTANTYLLYHSQDLPYGGEGWTRLVSTKDGSDVYHYTTVMVYCGKEYWSKRKWGYGKVTQTVFTGPSASNVEVYYGTAA